MGDTYQSNTLHTPITKDTLPKSREWTQQREIQVNKNNTFYCTMHPSVGTGEDWDWIIYDGGDA